MFTKDEYKILNIQYNEKINSPLTSSCGRVLDAASALLDICKVKTYDGRPAMLLDSVSTDPYKLNPVIKNNILMTTPLFEFLVKNINKNKGRLAATVEKYLASGLYLIASKGNKPILFGGGCAYNDRMSSYMLERGVLTNKQIPAGDGGISSGQIAHILNYLNEK